MLQAKRIQAPGSTLPSRIIENSGGSPRTWRCRNLDGVSHQSAYRTTVPVNCGSSPEPARQAEQVDPLYLFACHIQWERYEEPTAGWELISAAQSGDSDTRAHARSLLANSRHLGGIGLGVAPNCTTSRRRRTSEENDMKGPYGLEITDSCAECTSLHMGSFCDFSQSVLQSLDQVSHKTTLPAGAILFVEGQAPRGMFVICSGRVNLSTTSREGKILILKTAGPGEALGLSATITGMGYETTTETSTPCQVSFVDRKHFLELMQLHSEVGVHTAQCLSRDYRSAYHDIHDLVLTRSSSGKLARLLLSQCRELESGDVDNCPTTPMTHEEMAQRIGASRETVTRLLSILRKRRLIRLDGPTLVIRDRSALEALAV